VCLSTRSNTAGLPRAAPTMSAATANAFPLASSDSSSADPSLHRDLPAKLPLPLKIVLALLFLPQELSLFFGDLRLTPERLFLLLLTPIVVIRLGQKIAAGRYRFIASDLFAFIAAIWMFLGPTIVGDFGEALRHSGPVALEYLISYLATRTLLAQRGQALAFASWLCFIISIVAIDGLVDTATGRYTTRELLGQFTGYTDLSYAFDLYRFGLLRATGPVEHPILLGFVCAVGLLIAFATNIAWRRFSMVFCTVGVVIAFSSAAQQSVIMGLGLLAYGRLLVRGRWILLIGSAAICIGTVFLLVGSPFVTLIKVTALDPSTGYYRLYIWNSLGPIILDRPYFGIPPELSAQVYKGTVDSLWLVLSLLYGIPCAVFTGLAMITACSRVERGGNRLLTREEARLALILSIVIFLAIFGGFTVHFWGSTWILIGLLVGLRAHLGELALLNASATWRTMEQPDGPPSPDV
jgi:hypothetical protein